MSDLFKKYNVQGPRYTSYPTVPYWEISPDQNQWIKLLGEELKISKQAGRGAAIYIHIPFCESLCTYCGCHKRITKKHELSKPYIEAVQQEWQNYKDRLGISKIDVSELHLGGGTPTFMTPDELKQLLEPIISDFDLVEGYEFSFEADPRVTNYEHLKALAELGFKRISFGIQDFDPKVQEIVNRIQSEEEVARLTEDARELGYDSINYDLIYGLPLQTQDSIKRTIGFVSELKPDRIAFYSYAHVPWISPAQRRYTEDDLPKGEEKRQLYELGRKMLEDAGYHEIGMDHFALENDSLWQAVEGKTLFRNFMGYMPKHVSPMIGLGVSSIGDSWTAFAQNEKDLDKYQQLAAAGEIPIFRGHVLSQEDLILRKHILNLMTRGYTDWQQNDRFTEFLLQLDENLIEFSNDNLIERAKNSITVTDKGRAFIRNICMAFDARLQRKRPDTQMFSKTI
jgi:oxygen-independent coproporphyrinogen-3 oxidase